MGIHFCFLRCSLKKSFYCPKCFFFCPVRLFLSWFCGWREKAFFVCVHWHFWDVGFFTPSLVYMRQKKNTEYSFPCPSFYPKFPSYPTFFLPLRFVLCLFHIQCPEVLVVRSRVVTEKYIYSNFLETEVQMIVF